MAPGSVGITGCGKYLPRACVLNQNLAMECGVSADWIESRTGIHSRHYAAPDETAAFMGTQASLRAIETSGIRAEDIGLIICCTYSGEFKFPPVACQIQQKIGAIHAGAFDLSSGSAGFVAALTAASDRMALNPEVRHALIVTTAVQSHFLKKDDPNTSVIFGDGAAAFILSRVLEGYGILASEFFSDPRALDAIRLEAKDGKKIEMDGLSVGRLYVKNQPLLIERVLKQAGVDQKDIQLFIFHQANPKMVELVVSKMKLKADQTFTNAAIYGNTSDSSVALALCEAVEQGRIRTGNHVILSGVGPGMTFAVSLIRWQ